MLEAITKRLKRLKNGKRGVSNVLVVMLSLILITVIVANVVLWNYQMNQLDIERMHESISITNANRITRSQWFTAQNEFSIMTGSRTSGSYVNTKVMDTFYETFVEELPSVRYNPFNHYVLGSTKLVSGSAADLREDDDDYITFRSYISSVSPASKTDAFIVYRSNTGAASLSSPKYRAWDGDIAAWGGEVEMATAGSPVRFVRVAICPKSERALEKIVVTLSDDGWLDAYVFDGTSWTITNNIARAWTSAPTGAQRPFDIVYETASGRALLVYDVDIADSSKDLGYRIWTFGSGWSDEYYIDFPGVASTNPRVSFVVLASNPDPASNQVAMAFLDWTNQDAFAAVWNGSAWTLMTTLTTNTGGTSSTRESIGVAYSTYHKKVLTVSGNGANSLVWKWYVQGETDWRTGGSFDPDPNNNDDVCFLQLKPDPAGNSTHDYMMYVGVNDLSDLNAWAWNMAEVTPSRYHIVNEVDEGIDTYNGRCLDFAWEPTGNKGLIVWGTTSGYIHYNTYSVSTGWGASWTESVAMAGGIHPWIQLRTNPRAINDDAKILGAVLTATVYDLGAIRWDGTTLTVIGTTTFTANTATIIYECFELEFSLFGDPTEFTVEVEFTGASNTEGWTQLVWTGNGCFTESSVNVTFQLFDYQLGQYPTNGDGYISYTSSETPNTDETKTQTIINNPTRFRDANGNWRMKITGTKATNAQFDLKVDWMELKVTLSNIYRLEVSNSFTIDLLTYPLDHVYGVEILVRYNVSEAAERWFIKAYDWASGSFSGIGFNNTEGDQPTANEWNDYAISITENWTRYIRGDGAIQIMFCDEGTSENQTFAHIDFIGVRVILNGLILEIKNSGATTAHIVSVWVINATRHLRYDADFFINSGESATYIRVDIAPPAGNFMVKIVTERGNMDTF
ncbi:MAG: hypothetical protein QXX79_01460 [Candidatus Bathyarchaeia archaeon]